MNQKLYIGQNEISNLKKEVEKLHPQKIFLVTGEKSYDLCGAKQVIERELAEYEITRFSGFEINPKAKDIVRGIELLEGHDLVLSIGGGTVIDVGKSIAIMSQQSHSADVYVRGEEKVEKEGLPFIAVPTTFGTGSESTHFSVVYIEKTKYSLASQFMMPKVAIVDPQFSRSASQWLKANTAFDALNQAIESMWSVYSTDESREFSMKAMQYIVPNIVQYSNSENLDAALAMAHGSNLAGRAINIAKTTGAHSVSYPITSYFNVPHGQAVAIMLQEFIRYNSLVTEETKQGSRTTDETIANMNLIYKAFGVNNGEECAQKYKQMMIDVGLKTRFSELGIMTKEDFELIKNNGYNPQRMKNNPRSFPESDLMSMLEKLR